MAARPAPPCRYGAVWGEWREVGPTGGSTTTRTLELEGSDTVTAATGYTEDGSGWMRSLKLHTTRSTFGPHGDHRPYSGSSLRPSPSVPGIRLTHLSGCETEYQWELCFHWAGPAE